MKDNKEPLTCGDARTRGIQRLEAAYVPDPDVDAAALLTLVTGKTRAQQFLRKDELLSKEEEERYFSLIERRCERIPLQHITGEQEFMGLPFYVNGHVLIPRQDTETLVETALKALNPGDRILDVCTGSGCILISLLKLHGYLSGEGIDISEEALSVARRNAKRNEVKADFFQSDLFTNVTQKYDAILSNPPYIPRGVIPHLMPEVRDHDPRLALDGGEDGLDFYRRITKEAPAHLYRKGQLFFEVGVGEAEAVSALMEDAGFSEIRVKKDYSGNDRVVYGRCNDSAA